MIIIIITHRLFMQTVEPNNCRQQANWIRSRFTPGLAYTNLINGVLLMHSIPMKDGFHDVPLSNTFDSRDRAASVGDALGCSQNRTHFDFGSA
jgi:hypothetical protein